MNHQTEIDIPVPIAELPRRIEKTLDKIIPPFAGPKELAAKELVLSDVRKLIDEVFSLRAKLVYGGKDDNP